jgi:hypothetical protein
MFRTDYRETKKKEQLRLIGNNITGMVDLPFSPSRVPIWCPVCGYKAWAILEGDLFVTHCMRACSKPIKNQLMVIKDESY